MVNTNHITVHIAPTVHIANLGRNRRYALSKADSSIMALTDSSEMCDLELLHMDCAQHGGTHSASLDAIVIATYTSLRTRTAYVTPQ
eukprot:325071-Chlamydomonas_euryale.AAC.8